MNEYDVVVVGAGPAGCTVAKICAQGGLETLIVEKDSDIGAPKRCAEGLSIKGFDRIGFRPDKRCIAKEIGGGSLHSPSGKEVKIITEGLMGYVLERKVFEKHLARDAIKAGAKCMMRTTANGLILDDGHIAGVKCNSLGGEIEIPAKLVIGCDGVESKIGRLAGLKTLNTLKDCISGYQYEMAGIENVDMDLIHLFFGNEIAPKGYLWIFPKGEDMANVGIGIISTENAKMSVRSYLDRFIDDHPEIFNNASPIEVNAGGVPVSGFMQDSFVTDNLMLIGDSAQQVNPIHGGGMSTNMYAAHIAGRVAIEAIEEDNLSKEKLYEYEREWRETDGVRMEKLLKLRYFAENLSDKDFDFLADILSGEDLMKMQQGKTKFLLKMMIRHPRLLNMARKYLTS